jgi:hydroxymethylpyrimidine pyrophosphatase-like HAD family hydrolase
VLGHNKKIPRAVIVDLDGTLLHREPAHFQVKGKSGSTYLSKKSAELLFAISRITPLVIATGRNALSVEKLTEQIDEISFLGFILENGFVVRELLKNDKQIEAKWCSILELIPDWEPLPGYENCLGLIPPQKMSKPKEYIQKLLKTTGEKGYVWSEHRKIFIYPQSPDKTIGLSSLNVFPFIALGDEINDTQLLSMSSYPVTLQDSCKQIQAIVQKKKGYCSMLSSHLATEDMLAWALSKLQQNTK